MANRDRKQLAEWLTESGFSIDPATFKDTLADTFAQQYPGWTVEDLLIDRGENAKFIRAILRWMGISDPDCATTDKHSALILSTLLNKRKRGYLSLEDRVVA